MNERKDENDISYRVERALEKVEKYAQNLPKDEQDKFYHANIAGYFSLVKDMLPEGRYTNAGKVIDAMIKYHLQKAGLGLEGKIEKYDAATGKEKVALNPAKKAEQGKLSYTPSAQLGSYDNPATDLPLPKGTVAAEDDIPF